MSKNSTWSGRKVVKARAHWETRLPQQCRRCGRVVTADRPWTVGHIVDRAMGGSDDVTNTWPEHPRCNYGAGGKIGAAMTNARHAVARIASERARGIRGV